MSREGRAARCDRNRRDAKGKNEGEMSLDISHYTTPARRCKLRLSLDYSGTCKSRATPTLRVEDIPTPGSIVVGIRGIPISSRIKRAPLPLWGLTLPPLPLPLLSHGVNSPDLSLSFYLVNRFLSVRPSIRLAICFIALSVYLSFRLNHYPRIRALRAALCTWYASPMRARARVRAHKFRVYKF